MAKQAIFDKKNVLVIGGAGFIGSYLCDALIGESKLICLDNFLTGNDDNIDHLLAHPDFQFINWDIVNPFDLEKEPLLEEYRLAFQGLQEIYFLASPTSPSVYGQLKIETLLVNSLGLKNALDLAVKYKAKFMYLSSSSVYGDQPLPEPVMENYFGDSDNLSSRAAYVEAKRFGETLVENYRQKYDIDAKTLRIFNAYGPRMSLNDGRMVPEMIKAAINGEDIKIYGEEKNRGSYCYISDVIKGIMQMMDSAEIGPLNLGSDWAIKFGDVATKVVSLTNTKSQIVYLPRNEMMAEQWIPSISAIKEKLGWFPIVLLDEGLKKTIDYLSAQKGILKLE